MKKKWNRAMSLLIIFTVLPLETASALTNETISLQEPVDELVFQEEDEKNELIELPAEETESSDNEIVDSSEEVRESAELAEIEEIKEIEEIQETAETAEEDTETEVTEEEVETKVSKKATMKQAEDGFWLVDSAATLTTLLKDTKKLKFRLTKDINLGSAGYQLRNGVIIDGAGHVITYNKGGSAAQGFYIIETDATVEIRNTQFGNLDGSGAIGYYGFLTGYDAGVNMTFIFDNVDYYSNNGQMIFNRNGNIILRGNNKIIQKGTGAYSQEWAETNHVEVESGTTTIEHWSNSTLGFMWSVGVHGGNPYANTSQIVVRENASLSIETNGSISYGQLAPSYIVEENASLTIDKVSNATGGARNSFFYVAQTQPVTFDFQSNSHVNFLLPAPINVGGAAGGMRIGEGADVKIDVASGFVFDATTTSKFDLMLVEPEYAEFSATEAGTLGLNGATTNRNSNFLIESQNGLTVKTYAEKSQMEPTNAFLRSLTDLRVRKQTYANGSKSKTPLTSQELTALSNAKKISVSPKMAIPNQVEVSVSEVTARTANLKATSLNNGNAATEVEWLLFTSEKDLNNREKAVEVIKQDTFSEGNTQTTGNYQQVITSLNPNTTYWLQGTVTNQLGQSDYSESTHFSTLPELKTLTVDQITGESATVSGELAGATAAYGGSYQQVIVEYSTTTNFTEETTATTKGQLSGEKQQLFTAELVELTEETTYYIRLKVIGVSGERVTLAMTPLTEFTTVIEIINVEIPIEMAFGTRNTDLGTAQAGKLYSETYEVANQGKSPVKVSLAGLEKQNKAAEKIKLRQDLKGTLGKDEMALQVITESNPTDPLYLTENLALEPVVVGVLAPQGSSQQQINLTGKYFNPESLAVYPKYDLVFKVEKTK